MNGSSHFIDSLKFFDYFEYIFAWLKGNTLLKHHHHPAKTQD